LAQLINQGNALIVKYQQTLPGDIAVLSQYVLTVKVNADSVHELLSSFIGSTHLIEGAYNAQAHEYNIRLSFTPVVASALQAAGLSDVLSKLGLPPLSCIPAIGVTCP